MHTDDEGEAHRRDCSQQWYSRQPDEMKDVLLYEIEAHWKRRFQELSNPHVPVFAPWYEATSTDPWYSELYARQHLEWHFPWRIVSSQLWRRGIQ